MTFRLNTLYLAARPCIETAATSTLPHLTKWSQFGSLHTCFLNEVMAEIASEKIPGLASYK